MKNTLAASSSWSHGGALPRRRDPLVARPGLFNSLIRRSELQRLERAGLRPNSVPLSKMGTLPDAAYKFAR
jgi:hypothetical protein